MPELPSHNQKIDTAVVNMAIALGLFPAAKSYAIGYLVRHFRHSAISGDRFRLCLKRCCKLD